MTRTFNELLEARTGQAEAAGSARPKLTDERRLDDGLKSGMVAPGLELSVVRERDLWPGGRATGEGGNM